MNIQLILFALYILAPKVDLVSFAGSGIRPEDVVTAIALTIYLATRRQRPLPLPNFVKWYLVFVGLNLVSAAVNFGDLGLVGFVFAARLMQYMVWFFIMYEACFRMSKYQLRVALTAVAVVLIVWGGLEYSGLIGRVGKFTGAAERLTINTSGPFETSVLLATLAYALPGMLLTAPLVVLVFLTQARITLIGAIVAFAAARPGKAIFGGIAAAIAFALLAQPVASMFQDSRLVKSESPVEMAQVIVKTWERVPTLRGANVFRDRFLGTGQLFRYMPGAHGDVSFRIRAVRWPLVIKTTIASPLHLLVGWGPGAFGVALDGYYVRVFGETGLLGLFAFGIWLVALLSALRRGGVAQFALVMMIIVAFFIDIFVSSKIVPLLWMFLALEYAGHPFANKRSWPTMTGARRGSGSDELEPRDQPRAGLA